MLDQTRELPTDATKEFKKPNYTLEINQEFLNFREMKTTKEEDRPWKKIPIELSVTKADGTIVEKLNANTPFFTFHDANGNFITVPADVAGHINELHIQGKDDGSKFNEPSLVDLFNDAAAKMPEGIADRPGIFSLDVEMGKSMGKEGVASTQELLSDGILNESDITTANKMKDEVKQLNQYGDEEAKRIFIEIFKKENPNCKIQFQLIRNLVLVPTVSTPKRSTTKLFMMFGPNAHEQNKSLYTAAPGRNMPRHPNPGEHTTHEGVFNQETFDESADAWFDTVLLIG